MAVSDEEALAYGAAPMPYFSHDNDAASDIKCRRLIRRLGLEGYGRFWLLCEALARDSGHRIPLDSDEDAEILGDVLMCGAGEARSFALALADVGLIDSDMLEAGWVASDRMTRNSMAFGRNRANGAKGGRPRKAG